MAAENKTGEETQDPPQNPHRRQFLQAGLTGAGMALGESLAHARQTQQKPTPPKPEGEDTMMPSAFAGQNVMNHSAPHPGVLAALPMTNTGPGQIPQKPLGKTGVNVSIIGIGGFTLGQAKSYDEAEQILHEAVDAGVTFMDNAWEYNEHKSEDWMGRGLQGRRDKVFLMTKVCTHGRDAKVAMQQLDESLRRLRTDHLDLWQIHEVVHFNDPDLHFMPGGAVEALILAKQQGKVRFLGFTGHKNPMIHLRMLELADQHNVKFDTVQMPLNPFDATFRSFAQHVLPEANRRGMGALGMKSLGGSGEAVLKGAITVPEALRFAMSLPVATTISGIDSLQVLRQNLGVARDFKSMTESEMQSLRDRCASAASDGHLELYKTTKKYDAAVGREQHGFPSSEDLPA
ncbi:MAG: aldo/keto reductase [Chthonomonadaceae bacterium]|nr:aldo/keto reductase [Chthonomonadaceae bacterium]